MKTAKKWFLGLGVFLVMILLSTWLICGHPWTFSRRTDVDLSSGEFRYRVYFGRLPVKSRIIESPLSREIRRLNIRVPVIRVWKVAFVQSRQELDPDCVYGMLVTNVCNKLISVFNQINPPDEERRAILTRFMTDLRAQHPLQVEEQGYILMAKLGEKYGVSVFAESFIEELKRSEEWGEERGQALR